MFESILEALGNQRVIDALTGDNSPTEDTRHRVRNDTPMYEIDMFLRQLSVAVIENPSILGDPQYVFHYGFTNRDTLGYLESLLPSVNNIRNDLPVVLLTGRDIRDLFQKVLIEQYLPAEREREREEMLAAGRAVLAFFNKNAVRIDKFLESLDKGDK